MTLDKLIQKLQEASNNLGAADGFVEILVSDKVGFSTLIKVENIMTMSILGDKVGTLIMLNGDRKQ